MEGSYNMKFIFDDTDTSATKTEVFQWYNPMMEEIYFDIYEYEDWLGIAQQIMAIELGYAD